MIHAWSNKLPASLAAAFWMTAAGLRIAKSEPMSQPGEPGWLSARVEYPAYLSQHDIVYQTPGYEGYEGFPLGNGDLSAMLWTGDSSVVAQINKCDTWDAALPGDTSGDILRSCGRVTIDFATPCYQWLYLDGFEARLSLAEAKAKINSLTPFLSTDSAAWVQPNHNVFLVACEAHGRGDLAAKGTPVRIALERWGSRAFGGWYGGIVRGAEKGLGSAQAGASGGDIWVVENLAHGSFAMAARVLGASEAKAALAHSRRGEILLDGRPTQKFTLAVAVVTSQESPEPLAAARRLLDDCESRGVKALEEAHRQWWTAFWKKSFVHTGNDYLENLYYLHLYLMGSGSRGRFPLVFNGGAFTWNHDVRQWVTPHHWNMQQAYWSLCAANHADLLRPYVDTYWRLRPFAEKQAERRGYPGAILWSEGHSLLGEMSFWDRGDMINNFTPASQIAQFFWEYARWTGDQEFLRERAYPFLKKAAEFYVQALRWDAQRNEFFIFPSQPYESPENNQCRNPITDLAMIRVSFSRLIEMSRQMNLDEEKRAQWQNILEHLPEYPQAVPAQGGPVFAVAWNQAGEIIRDGLSAKWFCRNCAPVFPAGDLGLKDKGTPLFETAVRTIREYPFDQMGAIEPMALVCARLGLGNEAEAHLNSTIRRLQHFPQGLFYNINHWYTYSRYQNAATNPVFSCQRDYIYDRAVSYRNVNASGGKIDLPMQPFIQHGHEPLGILAAAVNEMLLQSHDGVIRVFPGVPSAWPAAFQLRANGAFLVSATRQPGKPADLVVVESLAGNTCRMENPWPGQPVGLKQISGNPGGPAKINPGTSNTLSFNTEKGAAYCLRLEAEADKPLQLPTFAGKASQTPKRFQEAMLGKPRDY